MTTASAQGHGALSATETFSPVELIWFPVTGFFSAVADEPAAVPVNAIVRLVPRLLKDQPLFLENYLVSTDPSVVESTSITLKPTTAVIIDGVLCTATRGTPSPEHHTALSGDVLTPGTQLVANMPEFGLGTTNWDASSDGQGNLIYDVSFSVVSFVDNPHQQSLAPFAFAAPPDGTPVCLTDAGLATLPWQPPNGATWSPPTARSLSLAGQRQARRCAS
jgi:hypothetical protein